MKKQPQITEKTRQNFIKSFWKLYKDKNITKITVRSVCDDSNYDRTTFYRYFSDVEDILNQIENKIIDNIKKDIEKNKNNKKNDSIILNNFKTFSDINGEYIVTFHNNGNKIDYFA